MIVIVFVIAAVWLSLNVGCLDTANKITVIDGHRNINSYDLKLSMVECIIDQVRFAITPWYDNF